MFCQKLSKPEDRFYIEVNLYKTCLTLSDGYITALRRFRIVSSTLDHPYFHAHYKLIEILLENSFHQVEYAPPGILPIISPIS
jgi:hypothetical protein